MAEYTRFTRTAVLVPAALAALVACGGDNRNTRAALSQDTALSRDIALANRVDSVTPPQLQDVPADTPAAAPVVPAPVRPAPAHTSSAPRTPAPRHEPTTPRPSPTTSPASGAAPARNDAERGGVGTIAAGSALLLNSNSKVCTNTSQVGDRFTASVAEAVTGSNGATIPAGATATVQITQLSRSENARDKIQMGFRVVSVAFGGRTYAVAATTQSADVSRVRNQPAAKDRQKVATGAAIGAAAGILLGKGVKGAVIGAAGGGLAGAGVAAATANYEGCLNDGAALRVTLDDGVQVRL